MSIELRWLLIIIVLLIILGYIFQHWSALAGYLNLTILIEQKRDQLMVNRHLANSFKYPPKTIAVVSGSISPLDKEPREYAKISRQRLTQYCQRHQYDLIYFTDYYDSTAPAIWQKIYAVQEALDSDYQVVVWVDDDIYITDLEKPLEDFLAVTNKTLIFSEDMDPRFRYNFVNSGFFILRNLPVTRRFIEETLAGRKNLYDGLWNQGYFHEQSVMTYLFLNNPTYLQQTAVLSKGLLQSYLLDTSWQPGDFSIHLAGISVTRRNQFFRARQLQDNLQGPGG